MNENLPAELAPYAQYLLVPVAWFLAKRIVDILCALALRLIRAEVAWNGKKIRFDFQPSDTRKK